MGIKLDTLFFPERGRKSMKKAFILALLWLLCACSSAQQGQGNGNEEGGGPILPGIHTFIDQLDALDGKAVAVMANHTSQINGVHLVDTLLSRRVDIKAIFAPEHGFRGELADGARVDDTKDPLSGLAIFSLYGSKKKPSPAQLEGVELLVFDIQDVGARFYTYISSLHYIMEACAEMGIPLAVLDRPNPHIHYIDGPVLDTGFSSFVGMHPVPVVYGMSIGEYAQMINGEGWLEGGLSCELTVYPCSGYGRDSVYELPVPPSPNLPDMDAVYWYPSLCFFEGTRVSVGRGTDRPFTMLGSPTYPEGDTSFVPRAIKGVSDYPPQEGKICKGYALTTFAGRPPHALDLSWLWRMYEKDRERDSFFLKSNFIDKLAGGDHLRRALLEGKTEAWYRESWQDDLKRFEKMRQPYLIYR